MNQVQVAECAAGQIPAWNDFVAANPGGTFYHLAQWADINRAALGHKTTLLAASCQGQLQGVMPVTHVSSPFFGRILCSMPFVNYGGPCAATAEAQAALIGAAKALADARRVRYLELRSAAPLETDMTASTHKISMSIDLQSDPDLLWNAYSSKHRTNIRRSYKNELEVTSGGIELLQVFYDVMQASWRDLGTPLYGRNYFEEILQTFPDNTRIFLCSRRGEPVAVAFNGYFNGTVEGMWAGGMPAARGLQANYVLYWEMIQDACKRGCRHFHLGRSTADSGAEDFKRKWNASARQLYWYTHRPDGSAPAELNVDNPKFKLAIRAWRRIPLWGTRLLGPMIARGIP